MQKGVIVNIGQAAKASGVSAKMLRYYEDIGLLEPALRSASGYRVYRDVDIHTLRFVKRARGLGFSIGETAELLALWRDKSRTSAEVKSFALKHMADLKGKIQELEAMRRTLEHLVSHCHGDARPDCPIIDELAGVDPGGGEEGARAGRLPRARR